MTLTDWTQVRWVVGPLVIASVFYLIGRLERQIRTRGALFPGSRPPGARRLALALGPLVIGFCAVCWLSGVQLYGFILLGVALIAYGLDYGGLLELFQGGDQLAIPVAADQEELSSPAGGRCHVGMHHNRLLDS
jgi:hypothetical protein